MIADRRYRLPGTPGASWQIGYSFYLLNKALAGDVARAEIFPRTPLNF